MKQLCLLLDEIASIRSATGNTNFDPVNIGILAEMVGIQGLVGTYSGSDRGMSERDIRILKEVRKTSFNLRIPIEQNAFHMALSVAPDMVTFVDVSPVQPQVVKPVNPALQYEEMERMIADLQANNTSVSLLIEPEIAVLKSLSRMPIDYVELSTDVFTDAKDSNEEIVGIDKIHSAAVGATKLGIGVNCSGEITHENIARLAKIGIIEDFILGADIISGALQRGMEKSIQDITSIIRFNEND